MENATTLENVVDDTSSANGVSEFRGIYGQ
jgi:hypothetical protein